LIVSLLLVVFVVVSCKGDESDDGQPQATLGSRGHEGTIDDDASTQDDEADISNGERIYFTGADQEGERISYAGGPDFGGMMMGGYLTCAACHGPDAHGGRHLMHMQVMDAPPIYGAALSGHGGEEHEEGEQPDPGHAAGEGHEPDGYMLEEFGMAVVEGQHPDGEPLDQGMPRWQMEEKDLADLLAFLETIPR
jgi:hypothetical protein